MSEESKQKRRVQVGLIGHSSRGLGISAALMAALAKSPVMTAHTAESGHQTLRFREDQDFPRPTHLKGGQKKHIQAQRPAWRRPR